MPILRNSAKCRICLEEIESKHRHDFVTCKCGEISVDGGKDYFKRSARNMENLIDTSAEREKMSLEEFLELSLEPEMHLRQGQKLMLSLHEHRSDLYDRILNDSVDRFSSGALRDCFYDDSKVWGTILWIKENW